MKEDVRRKEHRTEARRMEGERRRRRRGGEGGGGEGGEKRRRREGGGEEGIEGGTYVCSASASSMSSAMKGIRRTGCVNLTPLPTPPPGGEGS